MWEWGRSCHRKGGLCWGWFSLGTAALTEAVVPLPGHRTSKQERARPWWPQGCLSIPFPNAKCRAILRLHIHFPSNTVSQSILVPSHSTHLKAAWTLLPPYCGVLQTPCSQLINVQVALQCPHGSSCPGPGIIKLTVAQGRKFPSNPWGSILIGFTLPFLRSSLWSKTMQ